MLLPVADQAKGPEEARDRQLIRVTAEENGEAIYYMNLQLMDLQDLSAAPVRRTR